MACFHEHVYHIFKKDLFYLCICVYVPALFYLHHGKLFASCALGAHWSQRAFPSWNWSYRDLWTTWCGTGYQAQSLCKGNAHSEVLSHVSSLSCEFLMNRWRALLIELVRLCSFFAGRITLPPKCRWAVETVTNVEHCCRIRQAACFRHQFKNKLCSWKVCRTCFC